jgi:hypothetical protein
VSLQQKILKLRIDALVAARHASFWQKCITEHGEEKATAFYTHLGLNHLETKSYEWEGLTLSREPKEHEKIAVKGIAKAQDSATESIGKILLSLREELISEGLKGIKKLKPATFHELTLQASKESRSDLRDRLVKVHKQGRVLVAQELERHAGKAWLAEGSWQHPVDFDVVHDRNGFGPHAAKCIGFDCKCNIEHLSGCRLKAPSPPNGSCSCEFKQKEDEFDELEDLVDLTTSRVTNDVQSRIIDAAARHALLGQSGINLITTVANELSTGSVAYIDRASRGLANRVINIGRSDEAEARSDEWERVEYSALLDQNVCEPCAAEDGQSAGNEDDLQPAPNPDCAGGDWCRCFHVWINQ